VWVRDLAKDDVVPDTGADCFDSHGRLGA